MRIAHVSPLHFPVPPRDHGGTERVIDDLCHALARRGHEVTLFAASGSTTAVTLVEQGPAVSTIAGAPPSMPSAMECVMLDRVAAMADAFDIIHCHTELYHAAVLRGVAGKLVSTIHWRADEADRQHYFRHFEKLRVVAISKAQSRDIPARNCSGVVHHGIPAERFAPGGAARGDCVFLGRLTDQKRPDLAIAIARAAGMPICLGGTIDVGNPTYFDNEVRPLLGAEARYVGPVAQPDKQEFLGEAAVLLFPIDWPEPFGLVMIEAMACGTPVVAFRRGSTVEVVDEGVTGFVVDTVEEAAEAVRRARLLDRRAVRAQFLRRFTDETMASGYEAIYARMIAAADRKGPP
ncbi:glycosyltransferase family 4 protein [Acuticoccus sp. MNP-M23]|uniref:glycosyltransferase family 4 protein n=1 Tax=Acuticoccus sp. MNP-M23 TaxID=3072793 RepID=UPI0028165C51|nr:glycosyltransferase family 4 protein [Acuticoccus sp. MNP-M23]WMS44539.1 glycosyltransferase family 4 protein [Acuticoccus sp. MNP-M23]